MNFHQISGKNSIFNTQIFWQMANAGGQRDGERIEILTYAQSEDDTNIGEKLFLHLLFSFSFLRIFISWSSFFGWDTIHVWLMLLFKLTLKEGKKVRNTFIGVIIYAKTNLITMSPCHMSSIVSTPPPPHPPHSAGVWGGGKVRPFPKLLERWGFCLFSSNKNFEKIIISSSYEETSGGLIKYLFKNLFPVETVPNISRCLWLYKRTLWES